MRSVEDENWPEAKGIQRIRRLPDANLGVLWDSIIVDEKLKTQLLSQAVLNFTLRSKVDRAVLPLHGAIFSGGASGYRQDVTCAGVGASHRCVPGTLTSSVCSRWSRTRWRVSALGKVAKGGKPTCSVRR